MKKAILILTVGAFAMFGCKSGEKHDMVFDGPADRTTAPVDGHNSENSLDWAGVYEATSPCADCDGIKTTLELNQDQTFTLTQKYEGKEGDARNFNDSGKFTWDDTGSKITMNTENLRIIFKVGENHVSLVDMKGNVVSKKLGNFYILKKRK